MTTTHHLNVEHRRRKRRIVHRPEEALQRSCIDLFKWILPHDVFCWHTPNGGARSAAEGGIFKAMGVVAGVPDLSFIYRGRYFGIELKAPGEGLSEKQRETQPRMRHAGARIEVAQSIEEVIRFLVEFGMTLRLDEEQIAYHIRRAA